jgi:hypothetical protein
MASTHNRAGFKELETMVEIPVPPVHMNDLKRGAMFYLNKYLFT